MRDCRLIAVDLDGTLLNSQKKISDVSLEAIRNFVCSGGRFVVSTGRPIQGIYKFKDLDEFHGLAIIYNGAMVVDTSNGEIIFSQLMDKSESEAIIKKACKMDISFCIWADNQLYCNRINEHVRYYQSFSDVEPIVLSDFSELVRNGITKILMVDTPDKIKCYTEAFSNMEYANTTFCNSMPEFLECFNSKVSKGIALSKIIDICGVKREETAAFGDAPNDISMIEYAGMGVAMGNASDIVKDAADYITDTNDNDGVAKFLAKIKG